MELGAVHYLPVVTTLVAIGFASVLWRHWRGERDARYLTWWTIGVVLYGVGTLTEALTTIFGWSEPIFRAWYVSGALLGGAPLAQGTVYLLLPAALPIGLSSHSSLISSSPRPSSCPHRSSPRRSSRIG